jgi:hypothetical protein
VLPEPLALLSSCPLGAFAAMLPGLMQHGENSDLELERRTAIV